MSAPRFRRRLKSTAGDIARAAAIVSLGCIVLFPICWMLVIALARTGFSRAIIGLVPERFAFENFVTLFSERPMGRWIRNSIIVATLSSSLSVLFGASCGYVLSR